MANPFWHIELRANDAAKAKQFYKNLFNWEWDEKHKDYAVFRTGEEVSGGIMENPASFQKSSHWIPTFEVKDIKAMMRKAVQAGATIAEDAHEEGEWGWSATIADPTGALVHFFEPKSK